MTKMFHQSNFAHWNLAGIVLPAALFLSEAATAQVTVTDRGLTAPSLKGDDIGYTGTTNQRFGWDTESFTQSFSAPKNLTIQSIFLGYNGFDNGDTLTMDLSVNGSVVATGIVLDGNNFSGTAAADNNSGAFYWMEFDVSALNIDVSAGTNNFTMAATSWSGAGTWALAPRYALSPPDVYKDGALSGLATTGDLAFGVAFKFEDIDADTLSDPWELSFPGIDDLADLNGTLAAGSGPGAGTGDFDGDGLSDFDEYQNGTNPTLADSDTDGINDLAELDGSQNPFKVGHIPGNPPGGVPGAPTNPSDSDSDDDGILDGEEIVAGGGTDGFVTNPNSSDTDWDVMSDLYEVTNNLLGGLDPTDPSDGDSGQDLDGDSIDNYDEYAATPQTRADKADTDEDGYNDPDEDSVGNWFASYATGTDPTNPDTDGDGLLDGQENPDSGVLGGPIHNSDPNVFDTDGDLYSDGDEVTAGTDPSLETGASSVPTGIPFRNVDFTNTSSGWVGVGATTLEMGTELLPGSGQYARIDGSAAGNGVRIPHGNPAAPFYSSVDFRIEGTLIGGGGFNILSSGTPGIGSEATTHCILRLFGDGSVQAYNGTAFLPVVPVGGIVSGTTYTAQIDHDIVAGTWSARIYNRTSGTLEGSISGVPDRPTSNPAADPLYFNVGFQSPGQTSWDVAVDNMIVSLEPITLPESTTLQITGVQFNNSGQLVIDFSGASLTDYQVTKSLNLQANSFDPLGTPLVVTTDANGIGQAIVPAAEAAEPAAFYRMEDAP